LVLFHRVPRLEAKPLVVNNKNPSVAPPVFRFKRSIEEDFLS
jgi:hypothetical protein